MNLKLGILSSHPIQYLTPVFRALAASPGVDLTVLYGMRPTPAQQGSGFGVGFQWDTDLTSGYNHEWLENISKQPDLAAFGGVDTPGVAQAIGSGRFDAFLVLGWNKLCFWQAMRAAWAAGTPLMVRGDSNLRTPVPWPRRLAREWTHRRFIGRFDACLAVGSLSADYFKHFGARRVFRSPHAVDNEWFAVQTAQARVRRLYLRRRWGLPENSVTFLFVGKLEDKKRPEDILKALSALTANAADRSAVSVLMAGDGPLRGRLETAAAKRSLLVRFTGFLNQSQMPEAYAAADARILPSDARETWGLAVNEAMASGLPVLVSDRVGCAPDLVAGLSTGAVFPCGDTKALSNDMRRFLEPAVRAEAAHRALETVRGGFTVQSAAAGILNAAREVRR